MAENFGKITQVIGPVVDIAFEGEGSKRPPIYTALSVQRPDGSELILEVEQHVGENTVRCVAMDSTDGLKRGTRVLSKDRPISVPTGRAPCPPSACPPLQRPVDHTGDPLYRY